MAIEVADGRLERFERYLEETVNDRRASSPVDAMIQYHFGYGDGERRRSGKRLRSQLLLLVTEQEGGAPEVGLDAAAAVELLHNYSLVHDDIEDGDRMRHGRETVWATYGVAHGINAGDSLCALSYLALLENRAGLPDDRLVEMTRKLHEANLAMCAGQARDIAFERADRVSAEGYLEMIGGKTAAMFAASCELGAIAAGAAPERVAAYAELGRSYGMAFQIRDDVLGTWGATEVTGKPSGADLARRKWTFPVVWALGGDASPERSIVEEHYARGRMLDEREVATMIRALDALDARSAADATADRFLRDADRIAGDTGIDVSGDVRAFLLASANRSA